jgi:hypothetical protein
MINHHHRHLVPCSKPSRLGVIHNIVSNFDSLGWISIWGFNLGKFKGKDPTFRNNRSELSTSASCETREVRAHVKMDQRTSECDSNRESRDLGRCHNN